MIRVKDIENLKLYCCLYGHTDVLLNICVSEEWSIIVSGSADKTCIIWDSNRYSYVRSLTGHEGGVNAVSVSKGNGDIVTSCDDKNGSVLRLWSLNGTLIRKVNVPEKILCLEFTNGCEGLARNIVAGGLKNGQIWIWDASDLRLLVKLQGGHTAPVTAIGFNNDFTQLVSGDEIGFVVSWSCRKPRELYTSINF